MLRRKAYSTNLDVDLMAKIRALARQKARPQNDLIEEAIYDMLRKYNDQDKMEPSSTGLFLLQTLVQYSCSNMCAN
jgi:hypothetical protein